VNCGTDERGICSLTSIQLVESYASATFIVDDITHSEVLEYSYDGLSNTDPDEDSDGTSIQITRPEATGIFVADLDGLNTTNGSKWRTRVTTLILDEYSNPVYEAKVIGYWSYSPTRLVSCDTDLAGKCSLLSSEFESRDQDAIGFTVVDTTHPAPISFAYEANLNSDPDGDSDGTTLRMQRPVPTPFSITDLDGKNLPSGSKWQTRITMTVRDVNGQPVANAKVFGNWSYGSSANCTTDAYGQCSLLSGSFEGASMAAISFTITDITHAETLVWTYYPVSNSDPDGDSDGTTLRMQRPVPAPIFVADLDGVSIDVDDDEWKASVTITVSDVSGNPVEAAKVYIHWSTGSTANCTTDANGQCTFVSGKMKKSEFETIELSVDNITHAESLAYVYDPAFNNDTDGDSNGRVINISKP
jgi:protocatechuate 3,4-dioxygenase beta subunit